MDYIKEMNAFYDLDMANQLTPNAISLYFALLNIANKLYWKVDFTVSNLTLQSRSGIADRKTLDRARNQLIQKGLIDYKPSGKVNQAGSYTVIGCVGQLVGKNATQHATQNATQNGTRDGTQNDPINKQNKTNQNKKENNPPISPFENYSQNGDLLQRLNEFVVMRKTIKKPMTDRAKKELLAKLDKLAKTDEEKIAILDQSIFNSWQGVFPLKQQGRNNPRKEEADDDWGWRKEAK
jgi:hypothetical protein